MKIKAICLVFTAFISLLASCLSEEDLAFKRYYTAGAVLYQSRCQNCHGINGEGLSSLIPPLTDQKFLKENVHNLSCDIKTGMEQPISINGKAYQGKMPAEDLTPIEIAQVLTYVGNSFGNKLNTIPIEQTSVDLNKCN